VRLGGFATDPTWAEPFGFFRTDVPFRTGPARAPARTGGRCFWTGVLAGFPAQRPNHPPTGTSHHHHYLPFQNGDDWRAAPPHRTVRVQCKPPVLLVVCLARTDDRPGPNLPFLVLYGLVTPHHHLSGLHHPAPTHLHLPVRNLLTLHLTPACTWALPDSADRLRAFYRFADATTTLTLFISTRIWYFATTPSLIPIFYYAV